MNRIEKKFTQLKRGGKKGFIIYIGAGDPNLDATRELALAFDEAGVDILELGVPFSDPLAGWSGESTRRAARFGNPAQRRRNFWKQSSPSASSHKFQLSSIFTST